MRQAINAVVIGVETPIDLAIIFGTHIERLATRVIDDLAIARDIAAVCRENRLL